MMIDTVSTLEGFTVVYGRRVGNTVRLIDHAIQLLFSGKAIVCCDHYKNGAHDLANKDLFYRILDRLHREHPGLVASKRLVLDPRSLIIAITDEPLRDGQSIDLVKP